VRPIRVECADPNAHKGDMALTKKFRFPWRYGLFLALTGAAIPLAFLVPWQIAIMGGFDIAVLGFMLTLPRLFGHDTQNMRTHARRNDANRETFLLVTGIVSAVILVAVGVELTHARGAASSVAFVLVTLLLAWTFSNSVYALHYAYLYYSDNRQGEDCGGISFPGTKEPDYWDFTYFSFTLGMTFQTSDTDIEQANIRRVVLFHSAAAFVFNIGVIAFTINVLGGS
jgi:uncharacterized membrane protein